MSLRLSLLVFALFTSHAFADLIYAPANLEPKKAKIIVVIHGCMQSAEAMAMGAGWNRIADHENLLILYPQVPAGSHSLDCWGWFLEENQVRDGGQLKLIVDRLQELRRQYNVPRAPAYAAGMSSGAATVAGLLSCYPEVFTAGAIHSGPPYGMVKSEDEAKKLLATGVIDATKVRRACDPTQYRGKLLVIHGNADKVVNPANARLVIRDFFGKKLTESRKLGRANGASYETIDYKKDGRSVAQLVMVNGLDHAWSGSNADLPFFSPLGPSATNLMWDLFSN